MNDGLLYATNRQNLMLQLSDFGSGHGTGMFGQGATSDLIS